MTFTKDDIKNIISTILECNTENILDDTPLTNLGYDSLKFISTVVEIESKYNIEILDSDLVLENFKDISTIFNTLKKYIENDLPKLFKCIITDCDGVLWNGISGEDGDELAYSDEYTNKFCQFLHTIREKGVLLAICSKNESRNIIKMLKNTSLSIEDFAIIETDVHDKVDSITYILSEFGFSADNAVFIDDSNSEIEYVKSKISELNMVKAVYEENFIEKISSMFSALPESDVIDRTAKFREQKEREKVHHEASSPEEYNKILETKTICERATVEEIPRLAELSQRANRFNLTGAKYSTDDIEHMLNIGDYSVYKLNALDKFGDMGLVAMAVVNNNIIENFIMSCRVFGRGFENELLDKIKSEYKNDIVGVYHPTGKNDYCKDFYLNCGVTYELR